MIIHGISNVLAFGKGLQILRGQFESACDASVNIVTLLKIDVFEEIAAHSSSWNGIAVHVDSGQVGDRTFHRHQPLAKVLVNAGIDLRRHHKSFFAAITTRAHFWQFTTNTTKLYGL